MDSPCHVFVKHSLSDTSFLLTAPFRGMLLTPESVLMMLSPNDVSAPWKSREHYRLYEPFVHSNTELARRTRRYQKFHWTTGFDRKRKNPPKLSAPPFFGLELSRLHEVMERGG